MEIKTVLLVLVFAVGSFWTFNYLTDASVIRLLTTNKDDIAEYDSFYDKNANEDLDHVDQEGTNLYYNLATDFYEYGWGQSFHFGYGHNKETREQQIAKLEHFIAGKLSLDTSHKVLDMGCGVGGPLRSIVGFSGAEVTGVTINQYQVNRAKKITSELSPFYQSKCKYVQGDYTKLPFADNTFDTIYTIEAMVHVMDRSHAFKEAYRVLKPGGLFLNIDWVMTDKFDDKNEEHLETKRGIEHGDGLPSMITATRSEQYLKESTDFELIEHYDLSARAQDWYGENNVPWYAPLQADFSLEGFRMSNFGRAFLDVFVGTLETIGLAPEGSLQTKRMLDDAAVYLVKGGETEIFTTSDYFLARKPSN